MVGGCRGGLRAAIGIFRARDGAASHCWLLAGAAALLVAFATSLAQAATPAEATSSRTAREEAVRAIPWRALDDGSRQDVQAVIKDTSIYRRLPTRVIDCDPDLFTFLLRHPDVVVDVWRLMGISAVKLDAVDANTYHGTDGSGTTGNLRYVYANWGAEANNTAVVYADGAYDGKPLVTALRAQSVLLLRSASVQETDGRRYVTVRVDSFIHIDQMGVELVAKTVQPWINKTADQNFIETCGFASTFSRTAEKNPQGMQRLASRLNTVDEPTRQELVELCYRTAARYAREDRTGVSRPVVLAQRVGQSETP